MSDLKYEFKSKYMRVVDTDNQLVSVVYRTAQTAADGMPTLRTPKADDFIDKLFADANVNLKVFLFS